MNNDEEIQNIVSQLKRLQLEQTELITRLEQLNEGNRSAKKERDTKPAPTITKRLFVIGDHVRILNPRPFQGNSGTIVRIGTETDRITILAKSGNKIVRSSKNITLA
jgi:transcription antitermination factor NusG